MPSCFGMAITSLNKYEPPKDLESILKSDSLNAYFKYKRMFSFSGSLKRKIRIIYSFCTKRIFLDYAPKSDLKMVRIYYDATTFERVTKDKAAKFVDMLSAIGGTMGLLTGFSIISGIEILYFSYKIMAQLFSKK